MSRPNTAEMPHDMPAEKALLGCLLIDNHSFDEISDLNIVPEDFYHPQYGSIFGAIKELHIESKPFDIVTTSSKLNDQGKLERVGGQTTLVTICEDIGTSANVQHYARLIKQKSVLRDVIRNASRVIDSGTNFIGNLEDFLNDVESSFFKLTNQTKSNKIVTLKEALYENLKELEKPARAKGELSGVSTGFDSLDRRLLGLQAGQMVIVAARPGMGKTALALNWALNSMKKAIQAGHAPAPVAVFSYEMMYPELSMRLLASESGVDSRKLRTKDFNEMDLRNISTGIQRLSNLPLFISDNGGNTLIDIRSYCRKIKAERGLGMIIIDYLQLMQPHVKKPQREQEIAEISRGIKMLANELQVPIIALSQLNRSASSRSDRRPQLQDLRESGSLEQDADVVCLIHREDYYDETTPKKGIAEVIVAKNRAGEVGTVELAWIGSQTKFAEIEGHRQPDN
jgi:replicative DNA helicase